MITGAGANIRISNWRMPDANFRSCNPEVVRRSSVSEVLHAMEQLDDLYRIPLVLFHVESHTYKEIAAILDLPIGSVMSRIARGRRKVLTLLESRSGREHRRNRCSFCGAESHLTDLQPHES